MDKKSIIGLVLIFGVMMVFFTLNKPSKEEIEKQRKFNDSIAAVQLKQQDSSKQTQEDSISPQAIKDALVSGDTLQKAKAEEKLLDEYSVFSHAFYQQEKIIKVENDLLKADISTLGAIIKQVTLKDYLNYAKDSVTFFTPNGNTYGLNLSVGQKLIRTNELNFVVFVNNKLYNDDKPIKVSGNDSVVVSMRLYKNSETKYETMEDYYQNATQYIEYKYTLRGDDYRLGFNIITNQMGDVLTDANSIEFEWKSDLNVKERDRDIEIKASSIYYLAGDDVEYLKENGRDDKDDINANVGWVSFKQQFFSTALIAGKEAFQSAAMETKTENKTKDNYLRTMETTLTLPFEVNKPREEFAMDFFFGPNKYSVVNKYDIHMEEIIPLGWGFAPLQWINRLVIIPVFDFLQQFGWNMGIIILVLTIMVKIVLFPLAYKSFSSSAKMKIIQPEVQKLNDKFPKKEQAMQKQQAMMGLYKRAGVNPMAGCLPMLLQFPILLAMFRFFPSSIELRQKSFLWASDLSSYDSIVDLPFSIPFYGSNVSLFCLLMTVAQVFYTRITMKQQASTNAMPGMKFMMYFMPVMMLFILNKYSSALNYYYFISLCFTFLQMWLIRKTINEKKVWKTLEANSKKPTKKSKWQERMEALEKQNKALQAQRNQKKK
ncbi:MAG: membrane protein insertase YidC [Bacteroidales bacterium]|jgi:YidC/Oxa1 family membrane protein insertase|nr:membrane protein insertase YidC [Bacteroidales bacterium]